MVRHSFIKWIGILVLLFSAINAASSAVNLGGEIHYDINVRIDPDTRTIEGRNVITVKKPRTINIVLNRQFEVTQALIDGQPLDGHYQRTEWSHLWQISNDLRPEQQIEIHWRGELSPLDASLSHEQTLGRPVAVSEGDGTFLPNGSNWYPRIVGGLARYNVALALPPGQRGLVAGRLLEEQESEQGYQAQFEFPFPAEGITLMAAPYQIETDTYTSITGESIQLRTYFHPQLKGLSQEYLAAVKRYLKLYEPLIGGYPFTEFSIVSSPTPTGFGMPTLTYLGINVLQLPFIRNTSLGHEVLHNWWGNGVYPDYQSGNWSEGLTTFMADYAYKELESSDAALEMRLDWLRDFAALEPGQDAPLADFTSRTHGASKIVGYNKSAMLFLMLRDELGEEIFNRAIQALWKMQQFRVTSWDHLQRSFEMESGRDLRLFFEQWLNRTGAPELHVAKIRQEQTPGGYRLHLVVEQSEPIYQLRVPMTAYTVAGEETYILNLQRRQQVFTLDIKNKVQRVVLDPEARLFRQLAPGEAPPILREVMVNPTTQTVLLSDNGEVRQIAETLAGRLQRRAPKIIPANQNLPATPMLVIGLQHEINAWLEARNLSSRPEIVSNQGTAQAWTLTRPDGASLAVVSAQNAASLEALIRPLPHYGRQSYMVFEGRQAIKKGLWPVQLREVRVE